MFPTTAKEKKLIHILSVLSLSPADGGEVVRDAAELGDEERAELVALADSHHVVVRAFSALHAAAEGLSDLQQWSASVIAAEYGRIQTALAHLHAICEELEAGGCPTSVMKSLDHTPDLGNDLDLFVQAPAKKVVRVFLSRFNAEIEARSWGDRLANKWNFRVPGLRESVEVHCERLGQTGEHIRLARRFVTRRGPKQVGGYTFLVPAPEERIIVATLQRMYRHFYFRLCDILNTAQLVESGVVDWTELHKASDQAGIWPGVATYLKICSDQMGAFRGTPVDLPVHVLQAARFGGDTITVGRKFLRVPIMPYGARLYTEQVTAAALRGDVEATFRLNLLPPLALAAAVAFKVTGSDKGIW